MNFIEEFCEINQNFNNYYWIITLLNIILFIIGIILFKKTKYFSYFIICETIVFLILIITTIIFVAKTNQFKKQLNDVLEENLKAEICNDDNLDVFKLIDGETVDIEFTDTLRIYPVKILYKDNNLYYFIPTSINDIYKKYTVKMP